MVRPDEVTEYWLGLGEAAWYKADDAVDETIRSRFGTAWEAARAGGLTDWPETPLGALAYLILTDQFPRNMFRGDARSFATDARALAAAEAAIAADRDLSVPEPERQFFYLPYMHSEELAHQDRGLALIADRMPETGAGNLLHGRVHREIIRRFGRFPYRNAALGRSDTAEERAFLDEGGYGAVLREIEGQGAA